jgi:hypothetical protein
MYFLREGSPEAPESGAPNFSVRLLAQPKAVGGMQQIEVIQYCVIATPGILETNQSGTGSGQRWPMARPLHL